MKVKKKTEIVLSEDEIKTIIVTHLRTMGFKGNSKDIKFNIETPAEGIQGGQTILKNCTINLITESYTQEK